MICFAILQECNERRHAPTEGYVAASVVSTEYGERYDRFALLLRAALAKELDHTRDASKLSNSPCDVGPIRGNGAEGKECPFVRTCIAVPQKVDDCLHSTRSMDRIGVMRLPPSNP
mmetsp:Transcript_49/g.163  ORF Transcript_49/g.163 Transcript_49/m.163 type:complete len:116 (-) Transcript_49:362-709(-)